MFAKICGLYSIFQRLKVPLQETNYSKSLWKVYTDAIESLIQHSHSLNLVAWSNGRPSVELAPSWVLDLTNYDGLPLHNYNCLRSLDKFKASRESSCRPRFFNCGTRMSLYGKPIGIIGDCTGLSTFNHRTHIYSRGEDLFMFPHQTLICIATLKLWFQILVSPEGEKLSMSELGSFFFPAIERLWPASEQEISTTSAVKNRWLGIVSSNSGGLEKNVTTED